MKKLLFLILIIPLTACERNRTQWQVVCDSGFKTPLSHHTYMADGDIRWQVEPKGQFRARRMVPGEICSDIKTITIVTD